MVRRAAPQQVPAPLARRRLCLQMRLLLLLLLRLQLSPLLLPVALVRAVHPRQSPWAPSRRPPLVHRRQRVVVQRLHQRPLQLVALERGGLHPLPLAAQGKACLRHASPAHPPLQLQLTREQHHQRSSSLQRQLQNQQQRLLRHQSPLAFASRLRPVVVVRRQGGPVQVLPL